MSEIKYLDPEQANSIPGIKQQFRFVKKALESGQTIPDIDQIRENANKGATAYQKPEDGIPASDLNSTVRTALAKAEDAISVPGEPGTVGQVLQLDAQGNPAWVTPSAGTTPDSEMSSSSTNAVQNKVITEELDKYAKKDGFYESMGVGTAVNLAGQIERTNDSMYRTSGGSEDIATGTARIEKISGNTVVWNQLFHNYDDWVDMGLPSGTLWCAKNIDLTQPNKLAASPYQYNCSFFSWGNIDGHNPISNNTFDYNWGGVNQSEPYYENQPYGETSGSTLNTNIPENDIYDAARANLGAIFRLPTSAQFKELFDNSIFIDANGDEVDTAQTDKRVTVNGVMGLYIQSKLNGARLFFSCSGYGYGRSWDGRGSYGNYWSSTWNSARYARSLIFYSGGVGQQNSNTRYSGFAVRPVLTKSNLPLIGSNNHKFIVSNNSKNLSDLTLIYGADNEPSTTEQFEDDYKQWFSKPLTYEPYNEGELIPVKMTGLKTTGFNQWDEEWEDGSINSNGQESSSNINFRNKGFISVIPNTKYHIKGNLNSTSTHIQIYYYDGSKTYIGVTDWIKNFDIITPNNCAYIRFVVSKSYYGKDAYNNDICINLSCSGTKDGTYEPYEEYILPFDVTTLQGKLNGQGELVTPFADGLKKAGSVQDEIYYVGKKVFGVKRVGSVDLGTKTWTLTSLFYTEINDKAPGFDNIICPKYNTSSVTNTANLKDKEIVGNLSLKYIYIKDTGYSDVAIFKTSMQGVMLYYELETPLVYELENVELPARFHVNDWGTEEQLHAEGVNSAPAILSIIYGMNAADTIRKLVEQYVNAKVSQDFTDEEKEQARNNINAANADDVYNKSQANLTYVRLDNTDGSTSYVINQKEKADGTYRDPSEMIVDHIPSKDNETKISLYGDLVYSDTIRRIRENSHIFVGRYDFTNNLLKARQASDTDKTKWASDNSTIVLSDEDDVFMKPPKFWWKCIKCDDDIYRIKFSMLQENIDETWFEWSGNTFIGVYEGFINITGEEGSEIKTLRSRPGVTPTVNESWTTFTAAARARYGNNNGRCVTYEAHQIMALLGYGWAGTTDLQSLIGKGTSSYPKITGLCDNKGMIDSRASSDGNSTSINFWGLENWWGDISEWIDNIKTAGNSNVNILEDDRTTISRTVITGLQGNDGEIKKMVLGDNADLIPKLIISNSNYNKAYSDYGYVYGSAGRVARRSGYAADLAGGSGYFNAYAGAGGVDPSFGSRLLYKGDYSIVNNLD